jgi:hypothetical protein
VIVKALLIDRNRRLIVYAGTNKGVYRGHSSDGGTTWSCILYSSGIPLADVPDLEMYPTTSVMRAGTHGRIAYKIL